ncbi:hypothetical protein QQ008_06310 [Fulvivirgaceae bacterium BMA10]|uniref:Uncharacterized protein n=1 Tax=Splendidivirga corallicola TaxID=3051826 RepID=A0ABT8KJS9_9BACT|nr:hypothetical protein [Fulvivirgaceae bacterium BMA10]
MRLTFVLLLLAGIVFACEAPVEFEQPQPVNQRDLNKIPKRLRGVYISTKDSSYLIIDGKKMISRMEVRFEGHKDSIDLDLDSIGLGINKKNIVMMEKDNAKFTFQLKGDLVFGTYLHSDTIFEISTRHKIRKFKGHYFLNYQHSIDNWKVNKLSLEKSLLTISKISFPKDLENLKEITEVEEVRSDKGKVMAYKLDPTRAELKKLLDRNFKKINSYQKIGGASSVSE